jgi:hypothetical protein
MNVSKSILSVCERSEQFIRYYILVKQNPLNDVSNGIFSPLLPSARGF